MSHTMLHAPTDTERLTAAVQDVIYPTIGVGTPKEWLTVEGLAARRRADRPGTALPMLVQP